MIRHDQFEQDVESLVSIYRSCADILRGGDGKHVQWLAVMMEGPIDQLRQLRAEMHDYLWRSESRAPEHDDQAGVIRTGEEFGLCLEQLRRLYRAVGDLRAELGQYHPLLYQALLQQFHSPIASAERSLETYLRWQEMEEVLAELERTHAPNENGAKRTPAIPPVSVSESQPQP